MDALESPMKSAQEEVIFFMMTKGPSKNFVEN